jgi:hypothetical protein
MRDDLIPYLVNAPNAADRRDDEGHLVGKRVAGQRDDTLARDDGDPRGWDATRPSSARARSQTLRSSTVSRTIARRRAPRLGSSRNINPAPQPAPISDETVEVIGTPPNGEIGIAFNARARFFRSNYAELRRERGKVGPSKLGPYSENSLASSTHSPCGARR